LTDDFIEKSGKRVEELYEMIKKNIKQLRECFDEEVTENYTDEALASGCCSWTDVQHYNS
jgi:hypothetical protein